MMSPRSQTTLPIVSLEVGTRRIPIESGWLTTLEQESGRRDWHANVLFDEIHLERLGDEPMDVVISTSGGMLRGQGVVTGSDPFGMTLAAAPGEGDRWENNGTR